MIADDFAIHFFGFEQEWSGARKKKTYEQTERDWGNKRDETKEKPTQSKPEEMKTEHQKLKLKHAKTEPAKRKHMDKLKKHELEDCSILLEKTINLLHLNLKRRSLSNS